MTTNATIPTAEELGITGPQAAAIYEIVSAGGRHTLEQIRAAMRRRGIMAISTGISARVRDINAALRVRGAGLEIDNEPICRGSKLHVYWLRVG